MQRYACLVLALTLVSPIATVRAHQDYRIVGTLTRVQKTAIQVKTKDETISIKLDEETYVTRDDVARLPNAELKRGRSVVVEATGDSYKDLVALRVRIVPDIKPSPASNTIRALQTTF